MGKDIKASKIGINRKETYFLGNNRADLYESTVES